MSAKTKKLRVEIASKAGNAKKRAWIRKFEEHVENFPFEQLTVRERRERILREQNNKCMLCNILQEWNGKILKFELDHINGSHLNESRTNLRLLCPNCHSQTDTYKTTLTNKKRYSDAKVIAAMKINVSTYKTLKSLGMNPHGGNYLRLRRLAKKHKLNLPYSV